jgi:hypothetical protein
MLTVYEQLIEEGKTMGISQGRRESPRYLNGLFGFDKKTI